jgi:large subunit ribosomal protein L24
MNRLKLKDKVIVISGKDKNKTGEVVKIDYIKKTVVVSGVNLKKKHTKANSTNGAEKTSLREFPINQSKVMHYSEKMKCASRIGIIESADERFRYLKKCGTKL